MSILSARDPKTILNDFLSQDDAAKIFRGGSVLARWPSIRKVAGSILLVAAFSRLGGYSVFRRVIAARPALSGGAWHLLAQRVSASRIPLGDGARAGLAALFLSLIIIQAYARLSGACRPQGGRGCLSDA